MAVSKQNMEKENYNHQDVWTVQLLSSRTQETDFQMELNHFLEEIARNICLQW